MLGATFRCAAPARRANSRMSGASLPGDGGKGEETCVGQGAANKQYLRRGQRTCHPASAGRSSTSVRVPGRAVRRGCSQAGSRTDRAFSHRRAHRHLSLRCARALRRVRRCAARRWRRGGRPRSSISGVSLRRRRRPSAEAKRSAPSLRRYVIDERRALVASLAAGVAIAAHERRSSIAARTRSVTSAAVAFHATECGAGDCRRSGNAQKRLTVAQRPSTFSCASPQYSLTFEFGFLNLSNGRA
jgi:hypothetical protein